MREFKKKGANTVQMCEPNAGCFVVCWFIGGHWEITLETNDLTAALHEFYLLVLVASGQSKYISEI